MTWYDEEFFNEPSEFETQMMKLKKSLESSIKSEFLEEMERLREENGNLQGIKKNFEEVKHDYERKKQELDRAIQKAEYEAKRARLKEIMEEYELVLWTPTWETLYGPKCDKCDELRYITIKLPSGKEVKDDCECRKSKSKVYIPQSMILYELSRRGRDVYAWYKENEGNGDSYFTLRDSFSKCAYKKIVVSGTPFEELASREENTDVFFHSQEECRAYCDYLNERNGVESSIKYNIDGSECTW